MSMNSGVHLAAPCELIYFHKNRDAKKKQKQTTERTKNTRFVETVSISNVSYVLSGDVLCQR